MNERIKLLAEQANVLHADFFDNELEVEKFAELIVQECLDVINQSNGVGDDDVIKISKDVEKHFGVEA